MKLFHARSEGGTCCRCAATLAQSFEEFGVSEQLERVAEGNDQQHQEEKHTQNDQQHREEPVRVCVEAVLVDHESRKRDQK